jgi:hypothetical protein
LIIGTDILVGCYFDNQDVFSGKMLSNITSPIALDFYCTRSVLVYFNSGFNFMTTAQRLILRFLLQLMFMVSQNQCLSKPPQIIRKKLVAPKISIIGINNWSNLKYRKRLSDQYRTSLIRLPIPTPVYAIRDFDFMHICWSELTCKFGLHSWKRTCLQQFIKVNSL